MTCTVSFLELGDTAATRVNNTSGNEGVIIMAATTITSAEKN